MPSYTTAQAAQALGVTPARVRQIAGERGLGKHHGPAWLFSRREIEQMRVRRGPGRPAVKVKE